MIDHNAKEGVFFYECVGVCYFIKVFVLTCKFDI